jgi:hypothetical protein
MATSSAGAAGSGPRTHSHICMQSSFQRWPTEYDLLLCWHSCSAAGCWLSSVASLLVEVVAAGAVGVAVDVVGVMVVTVVVAAAAAAPRPLAAIVIRCSSSTIDLRASLSDDEVVVVRRETSLLAVLGADGVGAMVVYADCASCSIMASLVCFECLRLRGLRWLRPLRACAGHICELV